MYTQNKNCTNIVIGGTMFHASKLIVNNQNAKDFELYIIDGQNYTQFQQYKQSATIEYNPCIPKSFNVTDNDDYLRITITFDANITSMREWYPRNICDHQNKSNYRNTHLFHLRDIYTIYSNSSLTINNLIIDNYQISADTNYPILWGRNCDIHINNALFSNITSSSAIKLFDTSTPANTVFITHTQFENIVIEQAKSIIDELGSLQIKHSNFINITAKDHLIQVRMI